MSTTREPIRPPSSAGAGNPKVSVSESRYSASAHGPTVDAGVQGGDGNSLPGDPFEPMLGHHGSSTLLPDLKNNLRSADEVERDRGPSHRSGGWTWPVLLGLGTFFVMLGASPVVVWIALSGAHDPVTKPPPPQQDELMGIPVRRGLK